MSLEVKKEENGGIVILTPIGRIDTSSAKMFEDGVMPSVKDGAKLAVKFDKIDYISSAGLRVVLMLGKKLKAVNGTLVLINMPEKIFAVFKMSGFDKVLKICKDMEEAKPNFN